MGLKQATVKEIIKSHESLQIVRVRIEEPPDDSLEETILACNYLQLGEVVAPGQSVLVNTTGIDLNLGTGGVAFIVPSQFHSDVASYGHMVKLRYTPLQLAVDSVEEQESPYHELLRNARSIEGMPVVCCELHSQMPLVAAALKQRAPEAKVAYIMDDSAALPLSFSQMVPYLLEAGFIDTTISCGQAFGGQYEAINVYSALLIAHLVCKAEIVLIAPGPGVAGTGTAFGCSSIAQGQELNAVSTLGGKAFAVLRLSWQDPRPRHHGLSHHSETVLNQVCLAPVHAAIPGNLPPSRLEELEKKLEALKRTKGHEFSLVKADFFSIDLRGIKVTAMGRTQQEDPEFFSASYAAGFLAAEELRIKN